MSDDIKPGDYVTNRHHTHPLRVIRIDHRFGTVECVDGGNGRFSIGVSKLTKVARP